MAAKLKKGDRVVVLTGRDKGKQGDILRVMPQMTTMIAPVEWRLERRSHAKTRETMAYTRKAIEAGDKAAAKTVFGKSMSIIDSVADKKIVHKNKTARHKSRLSAAIKAMA